MRNFFLELVPWPTGEVQLNPPSVFQRYEEAITNIEKREANADDDKLLDLSLKLFENDASHRAGIDSRASGMMAAISLAATLVTGVGFTTLKDTSSLSNDAFWTIFVTYVVALIYLGATVLLSFYIQGPITRETADPTDLVPPPPAQPSNYQRQLAVRLLRYTINNYKVNNHVAERLFSAQKCFRNAMLALVVGGIVTSIIMRAGAGASTGLRLAQTLARMAGCVDLPPLTPDGSGRWHGLCLFQGRSANIVIDADGKASFQP
jgi:hypothetical protein